MLERNNITPPTADYSMRRRSSSGSEGPSNPTVNNCPAARFRLPVAWPVGRPGAADAAGSDDAADSAEAADSPEMGRAPDDVSETPSAEGTSASESRVLRAPGNR